MEGQATEDNRNIRKKKPETTGHGNTQENTRHPQIRFPTQARPREANNKRNTSKETADTQQKRAPRMKKNTRRETFKAVELRAKGSDVTWKKEDLAEKIQEQGNDK